MKDSGIEGVGIYPMSWKASRLSYESYIRARLGWKGLKADEYVDEGYAFISAFNIQNGRMCWEPLNYITQERYDESPEIKLQVGDVLLVKDGAGVGKCARIDTLPCGEAAPNSSIAVITPKKSLEYRYVYYYLQSAAFSNFVLKLYNGMGVPHLTQEVMGKIDILIPSIQEQRIICDFLDTKCAEIDALAADIQSQIDTLEQYKCSVITEAVTKGLNPDAEMRDSGIDCVPMIPKEWKVSRFKYVAAVKSNLVSPEGYEDYPQVSPDNIEKNSGRLLSYNTVEEAGVISGNHLFFAGQILYSKIRPNLNKVTIAPFDGLCSADMYPIETDLDVRFVVYMMLSGYFVEQVSLVIRDRVKMPKINQDELGRIRVIVPPDEEQRAVADFLDAKCAEIDSIIADKKTQLETLDEYKKSLIFEYVTGKKAV